MNGLKLRMQKYMINPSFIIHPTVHLHYEHIHKRFIFQQMWVV